MKWEFLPATGRRRRVSAALCAAILLSAFLVAGPRQSTLAQPGGDEYDTAVNEVVTLDREISDLDAKLEAIARDSDLLEEQIEATEADVTRGREKLGARRKALAMRARSIYVNGRASNIEMLFSSRDFSDFIGRTDLLRKVTTLDARMIQDVRSEAESLEGALAELRRKRARTGGLEKELSARRARLEKARAEKNEVLTRAGDRRQAVEQRTGEVEQRMRDLNPPASEPVTGRPTGRFLTMMATAYCPLEPGLDYSTATGMRAQRGVVAVDPRVIPLGTRVHVEGYGNAIAGDTGSAIKGMRIDVCFDTMEEMNAYGWRVVRVEILD